MAEPRSKTLIQQLGFNDPELTSPMHDEMILWIADHVREYVEKDFDPLRDLAEETKHAEDALKAERERLRERVQREEEGYVADLKRRSLPSYDYRNVSGQPRMETDQEIAERMQGREKELRDLKGRYAEVTSASENRIPRLKAPAVRIETEFEKTVTTSRDFIVGFVDVVATVQYPYVGARHIRYDNDGKIIGCEENKLPVLMFCWKDERFLFEAKPQIRSLGELLRQIRTYQEYMGGGT